VTSSRRTARLAGLLYLLVAVFGFFGAFVARGTVVGPGDAAARRRGALVVFVGIGTG
jgi:hypothetical protein